MLFADTIEAWKGLNVPSATSVVLNTNRIGLFKVRASTKSDYYYSMNPLDRREKPSFIDSASSVANLTTAIDDVLSSNVMVLKTYPNNDITETPVDKNIDYSDFAYAFAYEADATKSWVVYYAKGFKKFKVLVNNNLAQLVDLAETGATTTTSA